MKLFKELSLKLDSIIKRVLSYQIPLWFLLTEVCLLLFEMGILFTLIIQDINQ